MPMSFDDLYPSRFLKASDLKGRDVTKTIRTVTLEELGEAKDAKPKVIITFEGAKKQWVVPRTCGEALKAMFGAKDVDVTWPGKRVTLFARVVDSFGGEVEAVRVRGSPDITRRIQASIQRGQKTIRVDVIPTGGTPVPVEDLGDPGKPTPEELAEGGER